MRFLILACFFLAASAVAAQNLKVATVDMRTLFKEYPGTSRAQKKYDDLAEEKKQDLADSEETLSVLQKELNGPQDVSSKREKRRKEKEFAEETEDYQNEKNRIQNELEERNQEMTQMLTNRIRDVVARIAQKEGIDLVLDSNDAVDAQYGRDLTSEVLRAFSQLKPDTIDLDSDNP